MVDTYEQAAVLRDKVHLKAPRPMKVVKVYG
jgi:protein-arginine kinase activator protein McsA